MISALKFSRAGCLRPILTDRVAHRMIPSNFRSVGLDRSIPGLWASANSQLLCFLTAPHFWLFHGNSLTCFHVLANSWLRVARKGASKKVVFPKSSPPVFQSFTNSFLYSFAFPKWQLALFHHLLNSLPKTTRGGGTSAPPKIFRTSRDTAMGSKTTIALRSTSTIALSLPAGVCSLQRPHLSAGGAL